MESLGRRRRVKNEWEKYKGEYICEFKKLSISEKYEGGVCVRSMRKKREEAVR